MTAMTKTKWFLPAFCVFLGAIVFVAQWIGGDARSGLISFASLAIFGLLILVGGRSETVRGLRGDGRDERFRTIDIQATAFAGLALITALIVAWLVELARGHDGSPYGELMAIGGVAYLAAIGFMRWRG
jgi:drug/metabolite transporter (DMT)-like permease